MTLSEKALAETRNDAKKEAEETYGEDEPETKDTLMYGDSNLRADELYFDKDSECIEFNGNLSVHGKELGYFSGSVPVKGELLIEIIEFYMKKLGKLKTVMEAIK